MKRLAFLAAITALSTLVHAQDPAVPALPAQPHASQTPPSTSGDPLVTLAFPSTSVFEVLQTYEQLTGRRLIRDANLSGPNLQIVSPSPVPKAEAIRIIESSLLLNGYTLVPVDDQTMKILGPSRAPRTEGLPLYTQPEDLPNSGDRLVSFYRPLLFATPDEAKAVLEQVIQVNAFGSVAVVPNTNALVITDKTPIIRKALAVLSLIDVPPAEVVTDFVQLTRANAEKVVEILDKMFEKDPSAKGSAPSAQPAATGPDGQPVPAAATGAGAGTRYENRLIAGNAKFVADKRTNRVLVVTRKENYSYVRDVITQLDSAADFEQPYVRVLNYVPVGDVFPVLTNMLADPDSEKNQSDSGSSGTNSQNPFTNSQGGRNNSQGLGGSGGSGLGSSGGGSGLSRPDRLSDQENQASPQSATIGEIRLIANASSNSVIVYGPPEAKLRADQILKLLDQRPKQVYLAVVIGQLRIGKNLDYGVNYLVRYQGASGNGIAAAALNSLIPFAAGSNGTASGLPIASALTGPNALPAALNSLSGLTVFGTIADSVDVYARFLESTNNFRVLSRPVIYTTNNRRATILSGQRVPVPTSTLTTATGGGVNNNGSAITSNIQYQDVVLKLEVIPLINSDREVNLVIAQTNDSVIGRQTISDNSVPVIGTQELTTSVRVPNGATIVLGGLITEEKTTDVSGLPYLSRVPVVGPLFGGRDVNAKEKRELIVLIQPVVVDSNNEMLKSSAYEGDRSVLGRDAQAVTAPVPEQVIQPPPWTPAPSPTPKPKRTPAKPYGQSR